MKTGHPHFRHLRYAVFLVLAAGIVVALLSLTQTFDGTPAALAPSPQTDDWWIARHEATLARAHEGEVDLIMIGDSITQGWSSEGRATWNAYYENRHAMNLGFDGDRTEHVLWRLNHGEIDGITPKLAVLLIGTNNSGARRAPHSTPPQASGRSSGSCRLDFHPQRSYS